MSLPLVLVVEDNPTQQMLLKHLGVRCGFEPVIVGSCDEVIQALTLSDSYSMVLMDWVLSGSSADGLDCTRAIREMEQHQGKGNHVPIIGFTARAMVGDRETCLEAGMDDYLSKPFTIEQLSVIVQKWMRKDGKIVGFPQLKRDVEEK
jgi:CheY-like chemotaxis protein